MRSEPRDAVEVDERELVARLRAGDERAFDELADRYLPALWRFARRRLGGDGELARDVVQGVMCRVVERLDGFRGEAPLFVWMLACCRNEIAGHFRRAGRRPVEVELVEPGERGNEIRGDGGERPMPLAAMRSAASADGDPETSLLRLEAAELVHAALDLLPQSYARAVEWRYLEGAAVPEIARRLDTTYKATESLLSRARGAFRLAYERIAAGAGESAEQPGHGAGPTPARSARAEERAR